MKLVCSLLTVVLLLTNVRWLVDGVHTKDSIDSIRSPHVTAVDATCDSPELLELPELKEGAPRFEKSHPKTIPVRESSCAACTFVETLGGVPRYLSVRILRV